MISNIYLHYVLDDWFIRQIQPLLKGDSFLIRLADDFLLGFTNKEDEMRVMQVQTGLDVGKGQKANGRMDATCKTKDLSQQSFSETVKWRNRVQESCSHVSVGECGGSEPLYPELA